MTFPNMVNVPVGREDPIRDRYYRPLETAESASALLFWLSATLSFATILVDKGAHPSAYLVAQISFALAVAAYFFVGMAIRLYFFPRAEESRRKEFLSNALDVALIHERTSGYYNNSEREGFRRLLLCLMENAFFTKRILRAMAPSVRLRTSLYLGSWFAAALWRGVPLDWVLVGAQVLFSEELIAKWFRLEWLRMKTESLFDTTYKLVLSKPPADTLKGLALEAFGSYESAKSTAGILLSKPVFEKLNADLSAEWERVRKP